MEKKFDYPRNTNEMSIYLVIKFCNCKRLY